MRVVVAEDSVLFRQGLVRVLSEHGHDVVDEVGAADVLRASVEQHRPDLAVVDIRMPPDFESDGARAAAKIKAATPEVGILLLSQHIELRHCQDLLGSPGFGYLLKDRVLDLDEFDDAARRVGSGGTALDPEIVKALVRSPSVPSAVGTLTDREREVMALVAQGHANSAVAQALSLSERTVEAHMRSVFSRLGLQDDGVTHRRVRAVIAYLEDQRVAKS